MKINKLVVVLLMGFLFSPVLYAAEGVWVAVTVDDKRCGGCEYYGLVEKATFDKLTTKLDEHAVFKLSDVFWINEEGKIEKMSTTHQYGHKYGYTNTVYFREDAIGRIVILDKKYLDSLANRQNSIN